MTATLPWRLLLGVLFFAPLAYGAVEPWSVATAEALALLALWARCREGGAALYRVPGLLPLACLGGYVLFQLVPLPTAVVRVLSPETYRLHAQAAGALGRLGWLPLSLGPKSTLMEFFRLAACGALYVTTVQVLADGRRLRRSVALMAVFTAGLAVFALLQHLSGGGRLLWFREVVSNSPFAPYPNRNHYAGLMGMLVPPMLALFLYYWPRIDDPSLRERLVEAFGQKTGNIRLLLGVAGSTAAASVFVSLSRSGIVSLCLAAVVLGVGLRLRAGERRKGLLLAGAAAATLVFVSWFGWAPILARFERLPDNLDRFGYWRDCVGLVRDFPLTGTGFGTFGAAYPPYRTVVGGGFLAHAHNDYLQLLTEGGVVGLGLAGWFLGAVLRQAWRVGQTRRERYSIHLYLGCFAGLAALGAHSLTDFNLHLFANRLYAFFLLGLLVSASHTRLRDKGPTSYLPASGPGGVWGLRVLATVLSVGWLLFYGGTALGNLAYAAVRDVSLAAPLSEAERARVRVTAGRAATWDPLEPAYPYALGNLAAAAGDLDDALAYYADALRLGPSSGWILERAAQVASLRGDPATAEGLFRAGVARDRVDPLRRRTYAAWLLSRGEVEPALVELRQALILDPAATREVLALLLLHGRGEAEFAGALPDRVEPHLHFAEFLRDTGRVARAEEEYRGALLYLGNEPAVRPAHFTRVADYYARAGRHEEALGILQQAGAALPADVGLRFRSARLYEKLGIAYRAEEEYRQVLLLDPRNRVARQELRRLSAAQTRGTD